MDRKISKQIIKQRRDRKIVKISIISSLVVGGVVLLINFLNPKINIDDIRLSTASRGDLPISIFASGTVLPFYEEVITSPVSAKIVSVLKKVGEKLNEGDPVLELDLESFTVDVVRQNNELELKRLKLEQFKVEKNSALDDIRMQIDIDSMKLERMAIQLTNEKYLDSIGASTADKVKQFELDYKVQSMQFKQFKQKFRNQKKNSIIEIKTMELDYEVAINNMSLLNKKVQEASIRSPRSATLTWVNDEIGANIASGANIAIVSDLENFKIEGEMSGSYSDKVSSGDRVEIKIGEIILLGTIGNISPSIKDRILKFNVSIDEPNHSKLHSGLRTDLYIIKSVKRDVLCIDNSFYYIGARDYDIWVVNDGVAIKRKVKLGESNLNSVEVVSGLKDGDEVIISDMKLYENREKIKIKY